MLWDQEYPGAIWIGKILYIEVYARWYPVISSEFISKVNKKSKEHNQFDHNFFLKQIVFYANSVKVNKTTSDFPIVQAIPSFNAV